MEGFKRPPEGVGVARSGEGWFWGLGVEEHLETVPAAPQLLGEPRGLPGACGPPLFRALGRGLWEQHGASLSQCPGGSSPLGQAGLLCAGMWWRPRPADGQSGAAGAPRTPHPPRTRSETPLPVTTPAASRLPLPGP